jgi:putative transposase
MVYGYSLGLTMETSLVINSLNMAVKNMKRLLGKPITKLADKILIHQDRGSQYTSHLYVRSVLSMARISYSNPGTPTHNPGHESFFGRFKDEWRDEIAEIETFEELERFIKNKINYYNQERRHTSIGNISPQKFTKSFLKIRRFWYC